LPGRFPSLAGFFRLPGSFPFYSGNEKEKLDTEPKYLPTQNAVRAAVEINNLHSEIVGFAQKTLDNAIRIGELLAAIKSRTGPWRIFTVVEEQRQFRSRLDHRNWSFTRADLDLYIAKRTVVAG
jgi:hypothetical protein